MYVAGLACGAQKLVDSTRDARLALDRLEDKCRGALVDRLPYCMSGRLDRDKSGNQRRATASALLSCGVALSEPYVRPWNPRCSDTILPPRLRLRAHLSAASTAS